MFIAQIDLEKIVVENYLESYKKPFSQATIANCNFLLKCPYFQLFDDN